MIRYGRRRSKFLPDSFAVELNQLPISTASQSFTPTGPTAAAAVLTVVVEIDVPVPAPTVLATVAPTPGIEIDILAPAATAVTPQFVPGWETDLAAPVASATGSVPAVVPAITVLPPMAAANPARPLVPNVAITSTVITIVVPLLTAVAKVPTKNVATYVADIGTFGDAASATSHVVTLTKAVPVGDMVMFEAYASYGSNRASAPTITDSSGNAYTTHIENATATNGSSLIMATSVVSSPLSIGSTITLTTISAVAAIHVAQITGTDQTVSRVDVQSSQATSSASTSWSGGSMTTAQNDEILFAALGSNNGTATFPGDWTASPTSNIASVTPVRDIYSYYKIQSAVGSQLWAGTMVSASASVAGMIAIKTPSTVLRVLLPLAIIPNTDATATAAIPDPALIIDSTQFATVASASASSLVSSLTFTTLAPLAMAIASSAATVTIVLLASVSAAAASTSAIVLTQGQSDIAAASANAPVPVLSTSLLPPVAGSSASASVAAIKLTVVAPASSASASAPSIGAGRVLTPPVAQAAASIPATLGVVLVTPPAVTATALAPAPVQFIASLFQPAPAQAVASSTASVTLGKRYKGWETNPISPQHSAVGRDITMIQADLEIRWVTSPPPIGTYLSFDAIHRYNHQTFDYVDGWQPRHGEQGLPFTSDSITLTVVQDLEDFSKRHFAVAISEQAPVISTIPLVSGFQHRVDLVADCSVGDWVVQWQVDFVPQPQVASNRSLYYARASTPSNWRQITLLPDASQEYTELEVLGFQYILAGS